MILQGALGWVRQTLYGGTTNKERLINAGMKSKNARTNMRQRLGELDDQWNNRPPGLS